MRFAIHWVRKIHLIIALMIGLHFVLIAATGAIYIFADELGDLAHHLRGWKAMPGDVGPDRCVAAIASVNPQWDRKWLYLPTPQLPYYSGYVNEGAHDYFWTTIYVDPGTGRVLGSVSNYSWSIEGVLQVAIQLHIHLCAGEMGRKFVDISVALLLVELLTGIWLWWPGWSRLRQGFQVRHTHKPFLWLHHWHRVSGALAAPFLILMTVTGLLWGFPEILVPVVYRLCGETPPINVSRDGHDEPQSSPPVAINLPSSFCSLDDVLRLARENAPQAQFDVIHVENTQDPLVGVLMHDPQTGERTTLNIDRRTRRVLPAEQESRAAASLADRLTDEWAHKLHYGNFGGVTTKLLYLAACGAVGFLYVTGIMMWLRRRRKKGKR